SRRHRRLAASPAPPAPPAIWSSACGSTSKYPVSCVTKGGRVTGPPFLATIHLMRWALSAGALIGIAAWAAWGQRPEFDVASLKPVVLDGADTYTANLGMYRNGVLTQTNTTLAECLRFAYEITSDDLLSGPDWIKNKSVRFDILAKTAPTTPRSEALLMLRNLLEDRFKLVLRREPRVLAYYALTAPNGEHKMKPARDPPAEGEVTHWQGRIHNNRMTMLMLASLIARFTHS